MEIETALEKIGLNRNETSVYINTLKLGTAKVSEIAQKSKVKREACYYILKLLMEKGFISEVIKSGVKYYSATEPGRIMQLIEEEKKEKEEAIGPFIAELKLLQKTSLQKPKIEFYEGLEGLKTTASIMVMKKNQVIDCYFPYKILKYMPHFHPQFRRRRKEMNVRLRLITEKTKEAMGDLKKHDKEELRETRFSELVSGLDLAYYILSDGILILKANDNEQLGIYLKEESTAKLQKRIFENLWKIAKK